jgi:hypothetical protein
LLGPNCASFSEDFGTPDLIEAKAPLEEFALAPARALQDRWRHRRLAGPTSTTRQTPAPMRGCHIAVYAGLIHSRRKVPGLGLVKLLRLLFNLTSRLVCCGALRNFLAAANLSSTCNALGGARPVSLHRE